MSTLFSHFFQKFNQISPLEANFTEVLDAIALKPKTLYFHGKMPENMSKMEKSATLKQHKNTTKSSTKNRTERPKSVAIVGARRNTRYGEEVAYKMAYELAKHGVVVISGLAYGIDSIAHRGCLDPGGVTVAVLGTPIDHIYPTAHKSLAKEIIDKALSLTEPADMTAEEYDHAGDIYFMNGDRDKALEYWREALKLDKDNASIKRKVKNKTIFFD